MNRNGDKTGTKEVNPNNFANNKEAASKAGKKGNKNSAAIKQAITKSNAIVTKDQGSKNKRVTPEIQQEIRNSLLGVDKKGKPYYSRFISNFLKEAENDPNSRAGMMLASSMFSAEILSVLDAEMNKQLSKDIEFSVYRIRQTLYDKQQEVFDNNIDPSILIICTRRAGKTELNARILAKATLTPNTPCLYINRSFDAAISQLGKPLTDLLDQLDIKYTGSPGGGIITFENGSSIRFGGFNNKGQIDAYRGYKFKYVIIDEIGHLRNPRMLLDECIEPAMLDFGKEARLIYTGTPPRIRASYAYELWHTPIKKYHWSFMDNPFIPDKEGAIEAVCKKHGLPVEAPFIQREYFGNMEAFDTDAMIFRGYQTYDKLPDVTWTHAWVGVDWGYEDKAAVVSMVANANTKEMYIVDCWSEEKQAISTICQKVVEYVNELKKLRLSREPWVICDTNEKGAVYELYQTYKIANAFCAYKYDRDMALDQLAEWCRTGSVRIPNNKESALKEDMDNAVWERDEETDAITHVISDDYHPNAAMALLYASRQFAFDIMGMTDNNKTAKNILENR